MRSKRFYAASSVLILFALAACQRASVQDRTSQSEPPRIVTYNKDIAPILYQHCATCHRPIDGSAGERPRPNGLGELCVAGAPFSLLDYQNAHRHAREIADATRARVMPPWLPEPGHGEFVDERRLRDEQIVLIERWVAQGAPEGDPADRRPPPAFADGWQLGTPDLVLKSPDAFTLRSSDRELFRNFVVPVSASETRYVRAVEFRADNPRVLHHANVALDPTRASRALDRADVGPGFAAMPEDLVQNVFGWSPGKVPVFEPPDTAWTLEQGSDLVVQLHLVSNGTTGTVQPAIGLFFAPTPPTRTPIVVKLESKTIDIPAGEGNYVVEDEYVLPVDVEAVSVYPHAHALAKEMRGTASRPDGTDTPLIWIRSGISGGRTSIAIARRCCCRRGRRCGCGSPMTTRAARTREVGTAVDRRDGRLVAGGRAAAQRGRGRAHRRLLSARPADGRGERGDARPCESARCRGPYASGDEVRAGRPRRRCADTPRRSGAPAAGQRRGAQQPGHRAAVAGASPRGDAAAGRRRAARSAGRPRPLQHGQRPARVGTHGRRDCGVPPRDRPRS